MGNAPNCKNLIGFIKVGNLLETNLITLNGTLNYSDRIGFMDADIMQYPAMLQSDNMETFASEIPPMAYTGIETALHIDFNQSTPLPGSPFLQSVVKICPAVM